MLSRPAVRWDLTTNCSLACRHCQAADWVNHRGEHPPIGLVLSVIDKLDANVVSQIGLLGGEPLSFPQISLVLERLLNTGIPVTISTNGLLLGRSLLDLLRQSMGWSIMVSLDGPDRDTHEFIRGAGTFEPALSSIRTLVRSRTRHDNLVGIACTLNTLTISRMLDVRRLARSLDVDILQFGVVKPVGAAAKCYDRLGVSPRILAEGITDYFHGIGGLCPDGLEVLIDFLSNPIRDMLLFRLGIETQPVFTGCTGATSSGAIDPHGRLWPCPALAYTVDAKVLDYFCFGDNSLARNTFREIWDGTGFQRLREMKSLRLHIKPGNACHTCPNNPLCMPCPLLFLHGRSPDHSNCAYYLDRAARSAPSRNEIGTRLI